jgi:hypothetical protein
MARSYQYEPYLIPNIFRDIVETVSNNLSSDNDLNIPQVSFKHGSWLKIQAQLIEESKSDSHKNIRFPLIAMIHRYKEGYESNDDEFTADFIIFARRDKTARVKESYDGNFPNVLNPIYAEFRQVVCDSSYFRGYNHAKQFPKMDIVDAGEASQYGNVRYEIPEHLDAIVIKDLSMTVINPSCSIIQACAHDYDVLQLNYIAGLDISGNNSASLNIINSEHIAIGLTPSYTLTITGSAGVMITQPFTVGTAYSFDISSYPTGVYVGKITSSSTAECEFCFTVMGGLVRAFTKVIKTTLDLDLGCPNWPEYPSDITHSIDGGGQLQLTGFEGEAITPDSIYSGIKNYSIDAEYLASEITQLVTVTMTNNQENTTTIQKIFIKIQKQY